ncbi:MAG: hypothetical protein LBF87_07470 [Treponema sp.]|jgi:predicted small secreted protein|nr:hypothetical protein [Treponema sp.]
MKSKLFLAGILRKMKKRSIQRRLAELALALLIAGFMSCNTVRGDSLTFKDSGSDIGGCAYSEKAETSEGVHYLLSISYDEAVKILTEQFGKPKTGWLLQVGSALSNTEGAVVLEVNANDVRLAKKENGKYVVSGYNRK